MPLPLRPAGEHGLQGEKFLASGEGLVLIWALLQTLRCLFEDTSGLVMFLFLRLALGHARPGLDAWANPSSNLLGTSHSLVPHFLKLPFI